MVDTLQQAQLRVGDKVIAPADIAEEMQHHAAPDADQAWRDAAQALAIRELLLAEAQRQDITPEVLYDREGRRLNEEDALIETLLDREISIPTAGEDEARRYYDAHKENFRSDALIEAEHILFSASPDDRLKYNMALSDARGLIHQLKQAPHRFAEFARMYSACPSQEQGGRLGQISHGQTVEEFEEVLFTLKEGQMADAPVPTRFGVHIIRAGRRVDAVHIPFDQVDASIRAYLEEAAYRRGLAQYLAILAAETGVEGVAIPMADGPLVQ